VRAGPIYSGSLRMNVTRSLHKLYSGFWQGQDKYPSTYARCITTTPTIVPAFAMTDLTHFVCHATCAACISRYRYLQSRLLQCMDHSTPPCILLKLRSVTSAFKRLSLSGFSLI